MAQSRAWAEPLFAHAADLPISFVLDGSPVRGIPTAWRPSSRRRRIDANIIDTVFEGTDPGTRLNVRVESTQYQDYPVIEWLAWLTNQGQAPTPVISKLQAIDVAFSGASPVVQHCNGDFNSPDGYAPVQTSLRAGESLAFAPVGGRPCDQAFPYYRLVFDGWGLILAIGWPAQWAARFTGLADGVRLQAGQEKTSLRL